jgi:cytochrome c553
MDLAARQSVTLRSLGVEVPALDNPLMIARGAGHYELVCAACHGSPARPPREFAEHVTPRPPLLTEQMQRWRPPARTFWTVKHGIKRTAMPAWPTQRRDDEVWDVVAFLEAMPDLTAQEYGELAGYARTGSICARCHGDQGEGREGFPRIDIQSPRYLADALTAFRDGTRASGLMMSAASGLTDAEIAQLAAYYGRQADVPQEGLAPGRTIAERGVPDRDIPACDSCHGSEARPDFPRLAGQQAPYIRLQLQIFVRLGALRGGRHAEIMARAVRSLSAAEIEAVADWYGQ